MKGGADLPAPSALPPGWRVGVVQPLGATWVACLQSADYDPVAETGMFVMGRAESEAGALAAATEKAWLSVQAERPQ